MVTGLTLIYYHISQMALNDVWQAHLGQRLLTHFSKTSNFYYLHSLPNYFLCVCVLPYLEKLKVKFSQSCPTLCDSKDYTVRGILQARLLQWETFSFPRGSFQPRDQTQVSCITRRFFTSWASRGAQEYWSRSLSRLQEIFPTQESNWGLLHCRQILSYENWD